MRRLQTALSVDYWKLYIPLVIESRLNLMPALAMVLHLVECSVVWAGNRFVIATVNVGVFKVSQY